MPPPGSGQRDAGQHAVPAARQQRHAGAQRRFVLDLGQDAAADRDDRVGGKHQRVGMQRGDRRAFSRARRSAWSRGSSPLRDAFVDVGGNDRVGHDADAGEQVEAARARRGEDQPHRLSG